MGTTRTTVAVDDQRQQRPTVRRRVSTVTTVLFGTVFVWTLWLLYYGILLESYKIRLYSLHDYGMLIHEFDPYFHVRVTQHLYNKTWHSNDTESIYEWYDTKVWYPIGRPVGTTNYFGLSYTTVFIKAYLLPHWDLTAICAYVPAWFGTLATLATVWWTYQACIDANGCCLDDIPLVRTRLYQPFLRPWGLAVTRWIQSPWGLKQSASTTSNNTASSSSNSFVAWLSAIAAGCIMAILPAHLLRSLGGGYDNEAVAMTAMVVVFACHVKSLQPNPGYRYSLQWGFLMGLAYWYMVASWDGYIFVLNLIVAHVGLLTIRLQVSILALCRSLARNDPSCSSHKNKTLTEYRYYLDLCQRQSRLYWSFTVFYVTGTTLAIHYVPVVGYAPIKNVEQLSGLILFGLLQCIQVPNVITRQRETIWRENSKSRPQEPKDSSIWRDEWKLRVAALSGFALVLVTGVYVLGSTGYFGPVSSQVRGLFVQHTRTGNPLVDSVAEHAPSSATSYRQYLHIASFLAPLGFVMTALFFYSDASSFLLVYGLAAYYFSNRMNRLILLTAPISSALAGIVIGNLVHWILISIAGGESLSLSELRSCVFNDDGEEDIGSEIGEGAQEDSCQRDSWFAKAVRLLVAGSVLYRAVPYGVDFWRYSHQMAESMSNPTIVTKQIVGGNAEVIVDDYLSSYLWLRDNTPDDARVMAWWDYGYQITGISERTTLADGNTWNHEHIALLGRILTAPEKEAHDMARHLADYVLVWAGGVGDDLHKSTHCRRIANSVYPGLCDDPSCSDFSITDGQSPTESMRKSLVFMLVMNGIHPQAQVDPTLFQEVHRSKFGKVRIYKILDVSEESKSWVADPANRICDSPGSWICRGQYPPALKHLIAEKQDFPQLEDFNAKQASDEESKHVKQYLENTVDDSRNRIPGAKDRPSERNKPSKEERLQSNVDSKPRASIVTPAQIRRLNQHWEDNEKTSLLWHLIAQNQVNTLKDLFNQFPEAAHLRSQDGRGPLWWAYEFNNREIIELLIEQGVEEHYEDEDGLTPIQAAERGERTDRSEPRTEDAGEIGVESKRKLLKEDIEALNEVWEDTDISKLLYRLIEEDMETELKQLFAKNPELPHLRSRDGRGPMFWAYELSRKGIINLLKSLGVSVHRTDKNGNYADGQGGVYTNNLLEGHSRSLDSVGGDIVYGLSGNDQKKAGQNDHDQKLQLLKEMIYRGQREQLSQLFSSLPEAAHVRSPDGRGPIWWAYEVDNQNIIDLLKSLGASESERDLNGLTPLDVRGTAVWDNEPVDGELSYWRKQVEANPRDALALSSYAMLIISSTNNEEQKRAIDMLEKSFDPTYVDNPIPMPNEQGMYIAMLVARFRWEERDHDKSIEFLSLAHEASKALGVENTCAAIGLALPLHPFPDTIEHADHIMAEYIAAAERFLSDPLYQNPKMDEVKLSNSVPGAFSDPYVHCVPSLFYLSFYHRADVAKASRLHHDVVARVWPQLAYQSPKYPKQAPTTKTCRRGKIKLGIISGFITESSPPTWTFNGVLRRLDRDLFEITFIYLDSVGEKVASFVYSNPKDGVLVLSKGPQDIQNGAWITRFHKDVEDLDLDILFYLDVHMNPFTTRMAMSRLAPVQCLSHGHPMTTGMPSMDYFISWGASELATAQEHYTEKLVLLNASAAHQYYEIRHDPERLTSKLDGLPFGHLLNRGAFPTIPADGNWYTCMQKPHKFMSDMDSMVCGVLQRDPKGRLVLHELKEKHVEPFRKRLIDAGCDMNRVHFLPAQPHHRLLALYSVSDVILDSHPAGGDTTTREALEMNKLVVTYPGRLLGGRWSYGYIKHLGDQRLAEHLIASSVEEYCDKAVTLGTDPKIRQEMEDRLKQTLLPRLYEQDEAVRSWETVLKQISPVEIRDDCTESSY